PPPMRFVVQPLVGETIEAALRTAEFGTFTRTHPIIVGGMGRVRFVAVNVTVLGWPTYAVKAVGVIVQSGTRAAATPLARKSWPTSRLTSAAGRSWRRRIRRPAGSGAR